MLRQLEDLDEFFKLKDVDANIYAEHVAAELFRFQTAVRAGIETVLETSKPYHKQFNGEYRAVKILSLCSSMEIIQALRRYFAKKSSEERDTNIKILIRSIVENHSIDIYSKIDIFKNYIGNPRFEQSIDIKLEIIDALCAVKYQLDDMAEEIKQLVSKYYSDSDEYVRDVSKKTVPRLSSSC